RISVSAEELLSYPLAVTIRPPNLRKVLVQLSGRQDYAPNVECESPFSLMSVVLSSDAIGICGAYSDVFLYAKGDLVRIEVDELAQDQDALYTRYGIVSRSSTRLSPLAQAMI
ncbi:LysR family transcriptional regulator, partial [Pseudomonas sp. FSL R10-0071]|nr:LysR family transcriptional regulator [Pseudomonas sp. FSL R10-0071]